MKLFLYTIVIFTMLFSCSSNSKNESGNDSTDSIDIGSIGDEIEYLTTRDSYIKQLQRIQKQKSANDSFDSLYKAEEKAMSELESKLKKILKASRFSDKGAINLETLLGYLGFGMLDGLSFKKDSTTRIFYTTKNLLFNYFKTNEQESSFNKFSPDDFARIFNSAFESDVHIESYSFLKLHSRDNVQSYGMIAGLSQMVGPFPPQNIYVFVSTDSFVYMAEIVLKEPIKELSKCRTVWDSVHAVAENNLDAYRASNLKDTTSFKKGIELDEVAYKKYCECYNRELKNEGLLDPIEKQMELVANYLLRQ